MPALYRQYRPQRFADVTGQEHITTTLQNAVTSGRVAHAYLFHGPRGLGKTTTARILARRLNCMSPEGAEPCGTCQNCVAARENRLLDVLEIDAASNRGIDDIRALQETVSMRPSAGAYKVYIIDEVHMLTKEAFTALLKTLEEPAKNVVFVLASTEFHKIPETILSRCQVFHFRRASTDSMQKRLRYLLAQEKRTVDDGALNFIMARSDGCYRDAESLLGQVLSLHEGTITYANVAEHLGLPSYELLNQFLLALVRQESAAALTAVDQALALGFDPEQFIQETIRLARDGALALIKNVPAAAAATWQQEPKALEKLPPIIRALVQGMHDIAFVPEPSIALHLVIVTVCNTRGAAVASPPQTASQQKVPLNRELETKNKESAPAKASPAPAAKVAEGTSGGKKLPATSYDLQAVIKLWPQLIDTMKKTNPVAATFLRALKPASYADGVVQAEANFALHRSFFEKPDNQKLLDAALSNLAGRPVTVRIVLREQRSAAPAGEPVQTAEHDLVSAVKDVFGA
jgi:DNA polymerase III subunit gamma/tau